MSFKIPVSMRVYNKSIQYAILSQDYTHDYRTQWEEGRNKYMHILTGQLAQNALYEFCRLNNIHVEMDDSPHYVPDYFDLNFNGVIVDVKSTITKWPMQVTTEKKRDNVDFFCSCRIGRNLDWVQVDGFVRVEDVMDEKYLVKKGKQIPGGNGAIQKFEESYFYTGKYLGLSEFQKMTSYDKPRRQTT